MKRFKGRVAVITGAASGIGRALAHKLAGEGAHLALADVNEVGLSETVRGLPSSVRATTYRVDVASREAVYDFADQVRVDHGGAHIVFNNAGVSVGQTVEDTSYEDFEWLMGINFWGVVHGTKAFLPQLRLADQGHICNISSTAGLMAFPVQSAYCASKFAVRGFTESLRQELSGSSVGVSCVHPGGVRTAIVKNARLYDTQFRGGTKAADAAAMFDKMARTTPEKAAETILGGIKKGKQRILVGPDAHALDVLGRLMPERYTKLLERFIPD